MKCYYHRRHHNLARHQQQQQLFLLLCAVMTLLVTGVGADYPPPSEEGHDFYSRQGSPNSDPVGSSSPHRNSGASFVGDWSSKDWMVLTGHNQPKCLDIPSNLTLCRDIGYGQMRLPNLLEHDTLKEVSQQSSTWVRLVQAQCHPDTQIFLCSLFAPVCLDQPIFPCRTLCEAVKAGCEEKMLAYGFPWPEMLRCGQFPVEHELCIGLRTEQDAENETNFCPACSETETHVAFMNNFCSADFVMRIQVEQSLVAGRDLKIIASKKKKVYRSGSVSSKELRDGVFYLENGASCDCPRLDTVNGNRSEGQLVIMVNRTSNNRLMVTVLLNVGGHASKELRKAMRDIRKKDVCRSHSQQSPSTGVVEGEQPGKKNNKKGKKESIAGGTKGTKTPVKGGGGQRSKVKGGQKKNPDDTGKRPQTIGGSKGGAKSGGAKGNSKSGPKTGAKAKDQAPVTAQPLAKKQSRKSDQ